MKAKQVVEQFVSEGKRRKTFEGEFGDVIEIDGRRYVYIEALARGGVTRWFADMDGNLYYDGEDPSEGSDGMVCCGEWADAEPLGCDADTCIMVDHIPEEEVEKLKPSSETWEEE